MTPRIMRSVVPAVFMLAASAAAQQTPAATTPPPPLPMPGVGDMAPDFVIRGATRYGVLASHPKLSDFRGQTVVLAFFIQARTRG